MALARAWRHGSPFLALLLLAACTPRLDVGRYLCDPGDPASCPSGWSCQRLGTGAPFRCYPEQTAAYCGNGVRDPGEACDGADLGGQTCADLGFWAGQPTCDETCTLVGEGCRSLVQIAAGAQTTCAVDDRGDGWCWGLLDLDEWIVPEDLSGAVQRLPVAVPLSQVDVDFDFGCALDTGGGIWCWGLNGMGQLGDGTTETRSAPVAVASAARFVEVRVGKVFACGRTVDGVVGCWGGNGRGQLGGGSSTGHDDDFSTAPVVVAGGPYVALAAGRAHACALDAAGQAWCWGCSDEGRLGNPGVTGSFSAAPVAVVGAPSLGQIVAGRNHTCGLDAEGQAWCWGRDRYGELGDGGTTDSVAPVAVTGEHRFVRLAARHSHTCGLDAAGHVWCWGQLDAGHGIAEHREPVALDAGGLTLGEVAVGLHHQCGLTGGGQAWCRGYAGRGQTGVPVPRPTHGRVALDRPIQSMSLAERTTCALDSSGQAWCWGDNSVGSVGHAARAEALALSPVPLPVAAPTPLRSIVTYWLKSWALDLDGRAWTWGIDDPAHWNLGWDTQAFVPEPTAPEHRFRVLESRGPHVCGIDLEGLAWCWGRNDSGQLGDGTLSDAAEPAQVGGGLALIAIAPGQISTCGLDAGGQAWCWGNNAYGQLGDGGSTPATLPQPVETLDATLVSISHQGWHVCGMDAAGQAWCWGNNLWGQLGIESMGDFGLRPTRVAGSTRFSDVSAGVQSTCGVDLEGEVWCWGLDLHGRNRSTLGRSLLVPVPLGTGRRYRRVFTGHYHACAVDEDDQAWCWGHDYRGILGTYVHQDAWSRVETGALVEGAP